MIHRTGWTKSDRVGQVLWQFCNRRALRPAICIVLTVLRYGYVGLNGFAVDSYSCARKTGTDNQIAVSAKWLVCNGRGLFGSQSLFCSVFLFAFSPTKFFSWQGN